MQRADFKLKGGEILGFAFFILQFAIYDIEDVIASSMAKMIRRHPHVFGKTKAKTSKEVLKQWAMIKMGEKGKKNREGYLSDIPEHLPALLKAHKVTKKAAEVGFDWSDIKEVFEKVEEEIAEFKAELKKGNAQRMEAEFGDLIFSLVNVGRFIEVNPEEALRKTIARFVTRMHYIEDKLVRKGKTLHNATTKEMEKIWQEAKLKEKIKNYKLL